MRIFIALLAFASSPAFATDDASKAFGFTMMIKNLSENGGGRPPKLDFRNFMAFCRNPDGSDSAGNLQRYYVTHLDNARPRHKAFAAKSATVRELLAAQESTLRQAVSAFSDDCRVSAERTGLLSDTIESLERKSAPKADPCEDNRAAAATYKAAVSAEEERLAAKIKLIKLTRRLASAELKREQARLRQAGSELSAAEQAALAEEEQKSVFCARGFFQRECLGPFERLTKGIERMKEDQEQHLKFLRTKTKELEVVVKNCASLK